LPPHDAAHSPRIERIVGWLLRRRAWIVAMAIALGAVALPRSVLTYAALSSDLEQLLPANAPSVEALAALRARLPGMRYLGVVVDTGGPQNVAAAIRFLDDLAARVEQYPPELAEGVRTGVQEERVFAETYLLQLMEVEDVRRLRRAIEERRDWEVTQALDLDLLEEEENPRPELPIGELRDKYEVRYGAPDRFYRDRFVDQARTTALLIVHSSSTSTGATPDKRLIGRVRRDIEELGFPDAYAAGMRLGLAGDVAARNEEMEGMQVDLTTSALIVSLLIVVLLLWFFGSGWALPLLGIPLLLGTSYAFALVALPPLGIRSLNSNTAFLGSIVVGNGVNTGIILLARVQEERRLGAPLERALAGGVAATWRPTLAAAGAAAAAYGSLIFTDFRGFNQFGWIGGLGMLSCWVTSMVLLPVLMSFIGERMPVARARAGRDRGRNLLVALLGRPRFVATFALVACALSVVGILWRSGTWMEYDFSKLRRRDSFVSGERYWGPRMNQTLGRYLTPTVVLADDARSAKLVRERVERLRERGAAGGLIDSVRTVSDVLRPDRAASALEAAKIAELITPRMLQEIEPADRRVVERAVSPAAQRPIEAKDLPEALVAGLRELDGRVDRNVLVFPKLEAGTWQSVPIARFTADLREAATVGGRSFPVAGSLLLSSDITEAMRRDGPRATLVALSVVLVVCLFAFRTRAALAPRREAPAGALADARAADRRLSTLRNPLWLSAAAIGSILLGVLLMMGAMAWSGERLNFTNFVALPITFGIGADYSINMLRRWQSEGRRDMEGALASTGGAVALCSATTIIGFGSLLVAQNQMLFSFGVLAVAGELACLLTAIVLLPTLLRWVGRVRPAASPA
jgi:predicted RND superfamily exporter protein